MADQQFVPTGLQLTINIPGVEIERLKSFTPPNQSTADSELLYWNSQGQTENTAGDSTHMGIVTFSFVAGVPRQGNDLQKWFDDCLQDGFDKNKKDITVEIMEGEGDNVTNWNLEGCVPGSISYSSLTAGDPSPYEVTMECRCMRATLEQ
jgi:phage tail-like protein